MYDCVDLIGFGFGVEAVVVVVAVAVVVEGVLDSLAATGEGDVLELDLGVFRGVLPVVDAARSNLFDTLPFLASCL